MKKPMILAKSSLEFEQLQNKMKHGADGVEVQLLGEMATEDKIKPIERCFDNLDSLLDFPIYSIHTPLFKRPDGINVNPNVDTFAISKYIDLFNNSCRLAQMVADKQKHNVKVVAHVSLDMSRAIENYKTLTSIEHMVFSALKTFPNIELCIENIPPITGINKDGIAFIGSGYNFDNIILVKMLRENLKTDRIYTCLDTCHAEMTYRFMKDLKNHHCDKIEYEQFSVKNCFKENKDYIGLIHLSKTVDHGVGKGYHGMPFTQKEDKALIKKYLDYYFENDYTCPIVLEVDENDYTKGDMFGISNILINEVLNEEY